MGLKACQEPRGDVWTDVWMDIRTESLPILQDFVPCWGRCPANFCDFTTSDKQGKGTADLMMPFGDWLMFVPSVLASLSEQGLRASVRGLGAIIWRSKG